MTKRASLNHGGMIDNLGGQAFERRCTRLSFRIATKSAAGAVMSSDTANDPCVY